MEEINIKDLFEFLISKIRIVILVILLSVLVGAIYSLFFQSANYQATTRLVLTGTTAGSNNTTVDETGITQNDINLNSKLVATYREVIKSNTVLKEVINTLNLEYTVKELYAMVSVSSVSDTEMISISVTGEDAKETSEIANELARVFSSKIVDIYNIDNISIIDKAEVPTQPININITKQLIIYFLVGLAFALAIIFVMFYFDTSLKDQGQLEKLGLNVLCSIPQKQSESEGKKK